MSEYTNAVAADGPYAYYRFNNNLNDSSGNGRHAAFVGTAARFGYTSTGSFQHDATTTTHLKVTAGNITSRVAVEGLGPDSALSAHTLEQWVYPEAPTYSHPNGLMGCKRSVAGAGEWFYGVYTVANGSNASNMDIELRVADSVDVPTLSTASLFPSGLSPTQWHHVVVTYDLLAAHVTLYVNGRFIGQVTTLTLGSSTVPMFAGALPAPPWVTGGSAATFHPGERRFSDAAVYDYVLSHGRIAAHYAAGLDVPAYSSAPTLSGTPQTSSTISATAGTWTRTPTSYAYQWAKLGPAGITPAQSIVEVWTPISGATSSSLTLGAGDVNSVVSCYVSAANAQGSGAFIPVGYTVLPGPPVNTVLPAITGNPVFGATLTSSDGTWTNVPTGYQYLWQRYDGAAFLSTGANTNTYVVTAADANSQLRCKVTAINDGGSGVANTSLTAPVTPVGVPVNVSPPVISGVAVVGSTLTAATGEWEGNNNSPDPTGWLYQWYRSTDNFATLEAATPIGDFPTYVLQSIDKGARMIVSVTARNAGGSQQRTVSSASVGPVTDPRPQSVSPPTVSAPQSPPKVGDVLQATNGVWANEPTSYAYQWQSYASSTWTNVASEGTSSTYVLTSSELSKPMRVQVTASNTGGSETASSTQTAAVAQMDAPSNLSAPSISGQPYLSNTLSALAGSWRGVALNYSGWTYQWEKSSNGGQTWSAITGATSATYTISGPDVTVGDLVRVAVTATNAAGGGSAFSPASLPVTRTPAYLWGYWNFETPTLIGTTVSAGNYTGLDASRTVSGSGAPAWQTSSGIVGSNGGSALRRAATTPNPGVSLLLDATSGIAWTNMSFSSWIKWNPDIAQFSSGTGTNADPRIVVSGSYTWYPLFAAYDGSNAAVYAFEAGVPVGGAGQVTRLRYRIGTTVMAEGAISAQEPGSWVNVAFTSVPSAANGANQDVALYLNGWQAAAQTTALPALGTISGAPRLGWWTAQEIDETGVWVGHLSAQDIGDIYRVGQALSMVNSSYLEIPTTVRFKDMRIFGGDTGRLRGMWIEHNIHYTGTSDPAQRGPDVTVDVDKDIDTVALAVGEIMPRRVAVASSAQVDKWFVTEYRGKAFPTEFSVLRVKISDVGVTGNRPSSGKIYGVRLLIEPTQPGRVDNPVVL